MFFKYAEFRKFIEHLKSFGKIVPLGEWDFSNAVILRHDVDFDVGAAHRLALVEADCDIRSTFFFLTTCHTYNPFSALNREKLCEMRALGFEIGLHFDPAIYGDVSVTKLKEFVDKEAEMLSTIIDMPVQSISLHNPSIHGQYPMFEGYRNTYDKHIFSDDCYLSDSRMEFGEKNPYTFVEKVKEHPIQILLHPLHYSETGLGYPDVFYEYLRDYTDTIDNSFRVNSTYEKLMSTTNLFSYIVNKGKKK